MPHVRPFSWICAALCPPTALARSAEFVELNQRDSTCPLAGVKIFLFSFDPNHIHISVIPSRSEGRFAIVTNAGWDAVDVDVLLTSGTEADGQIVWS